jgi:hypothetical protein
MLHHVSIPATAPEAVAAILAELLQGLVRPAPATGTWFVCLGDRNGTLLEITPCTGVATSEASPSPHLVLGTDATTQRVLATAARAGWRAEVIASGLFCCVRVAIENRFAIGFLPPDLRRDYLQAFHDAGLRRMRTEPSQAQAG